MTTSDRRRRWPAYGTAALLLAYAAGKAVLAVQDRLGFPGGPPVPATTSENYFMDASTAQWFAAASGVLGACLAVATVTGPGRRVPRAVMLVVLAGMLLALGAGAATMAVDGLVGIGIGWQWYHGVLGLLAIGLSIEMTRSYALTTRVPRSPLATERLMTGAGERG